MSYRIIFFLIFLLPFVVLPFGITPFETPKVIVAEIAIMLFVGFSLVKEKHIAFHKQTYFYPFILLGLVTVLQLILLQSETLFLGNAFRMQGIFLFWLLLLFSIFSSQVKNIAISNKVNLFLLILHLILAFVITGSNEDRAIGTLGEPNALAAVLLFLWPLLFTHKSSSKKQIFFQQAGLVCVSLILLASGSRSGMIGFAIQIIFLLLHFYAKVSIKKSLVIAGLLFFSSLLLPFLDKQTMYERRDNIWAAALLAGYEHPIIGWGFGNTEKALEKYNDKLYNSANGYYVDSSHNIFLDWWVQGGILGLSLLVLIVYDTVKILLIKKDAVYLIIFLGLLTVLSFNPVSVVTLIHFWFVIGRTIHS